MPVGPAVELVLVEFAAGSSDRGAWSFGTNGACEQVVSVPFTKS